MTPDRDCRIHGPRLLHSPGFFILVAVWSGKFRTTLDDYRRTALWTSLTTRSSVHDSGEFSYWQRFVMNSVSGCMKPRAVMERKVRRGAVGANDNKSWSIPIGPTPPFGSMNLLNLEPEPHILNCCLRCGLVLGSPPGILRRAHASIGQRTRSNPSGSRSGSV
jgi:hypothetical protein